jgi:hypothetical protein
MITIIGDTMFSKTTLEGLNEVIDEWYKGDKFTIICSFEQKEFMFGSRLNTTTLEELQIDFITSRYPSDIVISFKYANKNYNADVPMYRWDDDFVKKYGYYSVLATKI